MASSPSYTLLATVRNEAPFLLEWIAYHKAIGFTKFVIFSNDCTDGTTEVLDALARSGVVQHIAHHPPADVSIVDRIAEKAKASNHFNFGDWVIWLDADEFLNIHVGDGRVQDLAAFVAKQENAQGMCVSWRCFGDAGRKVLDNMFVSDQFRSCAPTGRAWRNMKTLFQYSELLESFWNHIPMMSRDFWDGHRHFLGSNGKAMAYQDAYVAKWREGKARGMISEDYAGWDIAQVNHYAVRTKALTQLKNERGRIGVPNAHNTNRYDEKYYRGMNFNRGRDASILKWKAPTIHIMRDMLKQSFAELDYFALIERHYLKEIVDFSALQKMLLEPDHLSKDHNSSRFAYTDLLDVQGVKLPLMEGLVTPAIEREMRRGAYEGTECKAAASVLQAGDRVLELGGGIGLISCAAGNAPGVEKVVTVEANPDLIEVIHTTQRINQIENADVVHGMVVQDGGSSGMFYVRSDFWSSSMEPDSRPYVRAVDTPAVGINELMKDVRPTVVICDIEGGELGLFDQVDLSEVRAVIIELHDRVYGLEGTQSIIRMFAKRGFIVDQSVSSRSVYLFMRPKIDFASPPKLPAAQEHLADPKVTVVTCVRDEGPFLLEWLAYHRSIGIKKFLVFSNKSRDGSYEMLNKLDDLGLVMHFPHPVPNAKDFKEAALRFAETTLMLRRADYIIPLDVDEFITVRAGEGNFVDLLEAAGPFHALSMSELNFSSSGHWAFEGVWLTEAFKDHETPTPGHWQARRNVKTIVRGTDCIKALQPYRPVLHPGTERDFVWLDGSARRLELDFTYANPQNWIDRRGAYDLVCLNHYSTRSVESYLYKSQSDKAINSRNKFDEHNFRKRTIGGNKLGWIDRRLSSARDEWQRLMGDADLRDLHEQSVKLYEAQIHFACLDPNAANLSAAILSSLRARQTRSMP